MSSSKDIFEPVQQAQPLVGVDVYKRQDVHDEGQDQAVFLNARVQGFILLVLGRELHPGVVGGRFDVGQLDYLSLIHI